MNLVFRITQRPFYLTVVNLTISTLVYLSVVEEEVSSLRAALQVLLGVDICATCSFLWLRSRSFSWPDKDIHINCKFNGHLVAAIGACCESLNWCVLNCAVVQCILLSLLSAW